jgi:hypothetical protein
VFAVGFMVALVQRGGSRFANVEKVFAVLQY